MLRLRESLLSVSVSTLLEILVVESTVVDEVKQFIEVSTLLEILALEEFRRLLETLGGLRFNPS